jgi:hypothetical protein
MSGTMTCAACVCAQVIKIEDKVRAEKNWNALLAKRKAQANGEDPDKVGNEVNSQAWSHGKLLWKTLAEKLRALVKMRGQWGDLHSIYETRAVSLFAQQPLPPLVRDPDSAFSTIWDLTSVVLLLYIAYTLPVRACFSVKIDLWGVTFLSDVLIDLFFIVDVFINFRTAFFDRNGFRENRPRKIARHYLRGWFTVDFVSCLPVGYLAHFTKDQGSGGRPVKSVKALRLLRLTKMLRLARLQRILSRYHLCDRSVFIECPGLTEICLYAADIESTYFCDGAGTARSSTTTRPSGFRSRCS